MHPIVMSLIFIVCLIDCIFFTARLVLDMKMVYFGCLCLYHLYDDRAAITIAV